MPGGEGGKEVEEEDLKEQLIREETNSSCA